MYELLGMNCNAPTDIRFSFAGLIRRTGAHRDGRRDEAIRVARRAVALGGSLSEIYRQTVAELTGARPPRAASPGTP